MGLNRLGGWQRLALVLSAIYWVVAIGYAFNIGAEVDSEAATRSTAADPWAVVAESPAEKSETPPISDNQAAGKAPRPATSSLPSAEALFPSTKQIVEKNTGAALPSQPAPGSSRAQRWNFAFLPFAMLLGVAAVTYAAIAGLVWAGAGFRRKHSE
jgi:hypothetical protein